MVQDIRIGSVICCMAIVLLGVGRVISATAQPLAASVEANRVSQAVMTDRQGALGTVIGKSPSTRDALLAQDSFRAQELEKAGRPKLGDRVGSGRLRGPHPSGPGVAPIGVGSLPARLFPDGTVCIVAANNPSQCTKKLLTGPISKANDMMMQKWGAGASISFYGIFDVDNDGHPEVFFDYWGSDDPNCPEKYKSSDGCDAINLVVYKKVGKTYRTYLKLQAESRGYAPGA